MRRADGRRLQGGADRHRARHRHGRHRRAAVRGHDAARGRRDLSAATPRSRSAATGRADAERRDFTINALSVTRRRRRARLRRRARRSRGAARALHRRARRRASPRIICASCASSAFTPPTAQGDPDAAGLARLHRGARRARSIVARARAHGVDEAPARAARDAGARRDGGSRSPGAVLGGVPLSRELREHGKVEAALGVAADAVRRLGALGACDRRGRRAAVRSGCGCPMPSMRGSPSMGERWWRIVAAARRAGGARAALSARTGALCRSRAARLGALAGSAHDAAWRALATLPQRWTAPVFPLKAADFIARGVEKGPALGAALRAAEEAWIERGFSSDQSALRAIADAALRSAGGRSA